MANTYFNRFNLLAQINKRFFGAGIAATGVGAIVLAPQVADAAVILSGPVNINIPSTTAGVYLNVVTGMHSSSPSAAPGWDVNPWGSNVLNMFTPTPNPGGGAHVGSGTNYNNLTIATPVGPASNFASTGTNTINPATPLSFNTLIGFRFVNEANGNAIHYGWMRIFLSGTPGAQPRYIVDYGYQSDAGVPILAGVAAPEPSSLALLTLGAAGLLLRRRKATAH